MRMLIEEKDGNVSITGEGLTILSFCVTIDAMMDDLAKRYNQKPEEIKMDFLRVLAKTFFGDEKLYELVK